jgi:hypothetical protein
MESNNQPIGYLFQSIGYNSPIDLRNLIDDLTLEQSIIFITKSLEYAYEKGAFTMIETELISKSLAVLNSEISKKIIE